MPSPHQILQSVFGYSTFQGPQEAIVAHLVAGGDAIVLMPTGGGKSICYQIPALVRPGVGVVVSPLIALMQDQVDALKELGVAAVFLNSSLTTDEANQTERAVLAGSVKLLYVAPERLLTPRFLALLDTLDADGKLALFAIDEAHCVSQWGHDFRAEYLQLSVLAERFPDVPRVALTATADTMTRQEIRDRLHLNGASEFVASFDRPNIRYTIAERDDEHRQLRAFLSERKGEAGIVYCLSRKKVDATAALAGESRIPGLALPRGNGFSGSARESTALPARRRRNHGRDHCLRHGHRQAGCALCRASGFAQEHRKLLSGDRPRRARRRTRRRLDALRLVRRRAAAADDRHRRGRGAVQARRAGQTRCAARPVRNADLPPRAVAELLRRAATGGPPLRQLRQLPVAARDLGRQRAVADGAVRHLPHRATLRRRVPDRNPARQRECDGEGARTRRPLGVWNRPRALRPGVAQPVPAIGGAGLGRSRHRGLRHAAADQCREAGVARGDAGTPAADCGHLGCEAGQETARRCRGTGGHGAGVVRAAQSLAARDGGSRQCAGLCDPARPGAAGNRGRPAIVAGGAGPHFRNRREQAAAFWRAAAGAGQRCNSALSLR